MINETFVAFFSLLVPIVVIILSINKLTDRAAKAEKRLDELEENVHEQRKDSTNLRRMFMSRTGPRNDKHFELVREKIIKLMREQPELTAKQIAERFNLRTTVVNKIARDAGIKTPCTEFLCKRDFRHLGDIVKSKTRKKNWGHRGVTV